MRLRYETAIATFIQFITLAWLSFGNTVDSVVTTCHRNGTDCVSNLIVSLILFILIVAWFGVVWGLGIAAQASRNKRLAQLLILSEIAIGIVALFDILHHSDWLSVLTSLVDLCLAIWIIMLAVRLMKSDGGRIVHRQRHTDKAKGRLH